MVQEFVLIVSENETYKTSLRKLETENRRFIFASYSTLINAAQQHQPDVIVLFISEHQETPHKYLGDYVNSDPELTNLLHNPVPDGIPTLYVLPSGMELMKNYPDSIEYDNCDYVFYPFPLSEFQARIDFLIRRKNQKRNHDASRSKC